MSKFDEALIVINICNKLNYLITILATFKAGKAYVPLANDIPEKRKQLILSEIDENGFKYLYIDRVQFEIFNSQTIFPPDINISTRLEIKKTSLAYVMFTSGSTGIPKGVKVTHGNIDNYLESLKNTPLSLGVSEPFIQNNAYIFDLSVLTMFWPLLQGATLILPKENKDIGEAIKYLTDYSIRLLHASPSMLNLLMSDKGFAQCQSISMVFGGGEAWDPQQLKRLYATHPHCAFMNVYGPTEATVHVTTWYTQYINDMRDSVPIGGPIQNTQLYVVDDFLKQLPDGSLGELLIVGEAVSAGYLNENKTTTKGFIDVDGKRGYLTGDIGYRKAGLFYYNSRKDSQIKIRGYRIQLEEVEHYLKAIEGIIQAVVLKIELDSSQKLVAFITTQQDISNEQIRKKLMRSLPTYMIPHDLVIQDEMPINHSGKVDKKWLEMDYLQLKANEADTKQQVDVCSHAESICQQIWQKILKNPGIKENADFFVNGGDSLLAMDVVLSIGETMGIEIEIVDVFKYTTPKLMGEYVEKIRADSPCIS